jgi:hypothetical protein
MPRQEKEVGACGYAAGPYLMRGVSQERHGRKEGCGKPQAHGERGERWARKERPAPREGRGPRDDHKARQRAPKASPAYGTKW